MWVNLLHKLKTRNNFGVISHTMISHVKSRKISEQESTIIAYLRLLSCIAIVSCHIVHAYGNIWASVLNTGVQIFFIISGYLYGAKRVTDVKKFYFGRIIKVYLPYLIWTCIAAGLIMVFANDYFFIRKFIFQIGLIETLDGQRHLWFIRILAICYLILPLVDLPKGRWSSISCLLIFGVFLIVCYTVTGEVNFIWIATYYIGYIIGRWPKVLNVIAIPLILTAVIVFANVSPEDFKFSNYAPLLHIYTALVVISIFMICNISNIKPLIIGFYPPRYPRLQLLRCNNVFMSIINNCHKVANSINSFIKTHIVGRYEFETYLTHQTFILGPLTVIGLTGNKALDIFICLSLIVIFTITLKKFSSLLIGRVSTIKLLSTIKA